MIRLGLSTCFFQNRTDAADWESAKAAGFTDVEISMNTLPCEYVKEGEGLAKAIKAAGLNVFSIHVPFIFEYDISCPVKAKQAEIEANCKAVIDAGHKWGARVITTHASSEPFDQSEREVRLAAGKKMYEKLGDYAAERGMRLTVEVLPRLCMGNTAKECMFFSDGEKTFINFDVNHLLWESHADFIKEAGKRIITTHLSDYDFVNERHWVPGDGQIDWKALYEGLESVGYDGPYLFELKENISGEKMTARELAARFCSLIGVAYP